MGELFIIDSPATTLLQALTTNKKIIAFADKRFMHFKPEAVALLNKRVIFSTSKAEFLQDIATALKEPDWKPPEPINEEFLRAYGTYLNDGHSAQRSAQALFDLALGTQSVS